MQSHHSFNRLNTNFYRLPSPRCHGISSPCENSNLFNSTRYRISAASQAFRFMKLNHLLIACALLGASLAEAARAEDAYYQLRWSEIKFTNGELPHDTTASAPFKQWRHSEAMEPYATLDGEGEVFLAG